MNNRIAWLLAVVLPLTACAQSVSAPKVAQASEAKAAAPQTPIAGNDPRVALAAKIPGAKPEDLRATPIPGIFELTHGTDISYVTADAGFVFAGDLYKVASSGDFPNLSETRRRELRLTMLNAVPESQMLIYGPAKAAHTITVFTDIDCPWCQRLHSQMADYNKLGIRVRYLFYPRSGPNTESWAKADAVWCSADRKDAFTRAKAGAKLQETDCPSSPVGHDYKLGRDIGVTGTPGVVMESGELVPGYLSPPQMLAHIKQSAAEAATAR
jgi:thiol:disulfide interchange protein DsbC